MKDRRHRFARALARLIVIFLAAAPELTRALAGELIATPDELQGHRVQLGPRFVPGETLRYRVEFRTITEAHSQGPVADPQGSSALEVAVTALVRLEVLSVSTDALGKVRLRTTYEKSAASSRSDSLDPGALALEKQYRTLEGRSIEFTVDREGQLSEVAGLEQAFSDKQAASAALNWLSELAEGATLPREGIEPGQKWSSERPITLAPLVGLAWRAESTYLRDEPCRTKLAAEENVAEQAVAGETCAVLLTRFELAQHSPRDPTPEDYRKRSLRTAGTWSGSGESLSYLSLKTGQVVSVTQTGLEEMDVTVETADGDSRVRYSGRIRTQSQITLLPKS